MSDIPSVPPEGPAGSHRGFIDRSELPFLPRVRWRLWLPILGLLVAFPTIWLTNRAREGHRRRAQLLREHASLTAGIGPAYRARRTLVEQWIAEATGPYPGDTRDPQFTYAQLSAEPVLYARTRLGEIHNPDQVEESIRHHYQDQFTPCLGVESVFLRQLLEKGEFLLPSYVDYVRGTDDPDRLHALREDLLFRLRRDTEALVTGLRRRFLVLAVDEAALSIEGATRVFIWDVPAQRLVLRARSEGSGIRLVPFRLAGVPGPAAGPVRPHLPITVSQHDCAVAATVRAELGVPILGMDNPPPEPLAPTPDAGLSDGAVGNAPAGDATAPHG